MVVDVVFSRFVVDLDEKVVVLVKNVGFEVLMVVIIEVAALKGSVDSKLSKR